MPDNPILPALKNIDFGELLQLTTNNHGNIEAAATLAANNVVDAKNAVLDAVTRFVELAGQLTALSALIQSEHGKTPTYKILEATDSDEYTALDANKKAWYNLFISAGTLDMTSDGSKAWDLFLSWIFPPGTKSHTTILAAIS